MHTGGSVWSEWRRHPGVGIAVLLGMFAAFLLIGLGSATEALSAPQGAVAGSVDLVSIDMGGRVDRASSMYNETIWSPWVLLAGKHFPDTGWSSADLDFPKDFPQEVVLSFFAHQPAMISAVVINPETRNNPQNWAKDVEIWVSMDSPDKGFTKVAQKTLANTPGDQTISIQPTMARYLMIRALSNYGDKSEVQLGKVKVIEGSGPGYVPMLKRNPNLAALLSGAPLEGVFPAKPPISAALETTSIRPATPAGECAPRALAVSTPPPAHSRSENILVIHSGAKTYGPLTYATTPSGERPGRSVYKQMKFLSLSDPEFASPARLLGAEGFDTVVLSQVCERLPDAFKKALTRWVAQGHKLIIQDADTCDKGPDYTFLPYRFATSNPGAHGAPSDQLIFVEENSLANARPKEPGFLNVESWLAGEGANRNELGDSNLITQYDSHWCGHMFTTNENKDNGFVEAYAHLGRGLIIYDGFDIDQEDGPEYEKLVTRELSFPFDSDGLPCSIKIGDFVIATSENLKSQTVARSQTYNYPLVLFANHGYKGNVKMNATSVPPDPSLSFHFDSDTVQLSEISRTGLAVSTTNATLAEPHALAIRGTDENGKSNVLCLQWAAVEATSPATPPPPTAEALKAALDLHGRVTIYINFDFDKAIIKPESKPIVNEVIRMMKQSPDLKLSIDGYTDNVGTHEYNIKLSQARAAAVVEALTKAGIAADRLSSAGYGDSNPIADNDKPEGRAKNRRVELVRM
jgi:outer membrane protein OmpA-like peptidoglycan-associated protein